MLQLDNTSLFLIILPIVSFLYASVGHGGASGYLALMALFSFAPETMKSTALILNLFVAGISFLYYYKANFFNLKLFSAFAISSIPFAFLGGLLTVDASIYKKMLAVLLIFAILRGKMKEAAAVSALFIWVNSASGLVGQLTSGVTLDRNIFLLIAFAVVGAILGSYYGSKKINNKHLRHILAFVLIIACLKLVLT